MNYGSSSKGSESCVMKNTSSNLWTSQEHKNKATTHDVHYSLNKKCWNTHFDINEEQASTRASTHSLPLLYLTLILILPQRGENHLSWEELERGRESYTRDSETWELDGVCEMELLPSYL
jgi:hypothetical protein